MNVEPLALEVQTYTKRRLPQYVEELRELCAIDSESHYKPGLDKMAEVLAARTRGLGMEVQVVEREQWGNDMLCVARGDGGGNVVLLGHTDTVYPTGIAAIRPLRVEGDVAYGPGVSDMKGCILSSIYALEALFALGYRPFNEIRLLCVSDEEIDLRHSEDLIHHVFQDCQAALVLEEASECGNVVRARKGLTRYKLSARGRAAHSGSEPEKGRNAIVALAHQVLQFQSLNGWREGLTINTGTISGGVAVNVVPDYAEACLDVRFLRKEDKLATEARWQQMMRQHLVPDVELLLEPSLSAKEQPMVETPESMKLIGLAQEIAGKLGFALGHELRGGGSDASYASRYGVPVIDGLGPIGGHDHSPDEYLRLDSVPSRTGLLAGLIANTGSEARVC